MAAYIGTDAKKAFEIPIRLNAIGLPEINERIVEADLDRASSTPQELDQFVRKELAKYARVVKETGMVPQ